MWELVAGVDPVSFPGLVAKLRASREMVNDDVTVLVTRIAGDPVQQEVSVR